jgi:ABC-type multidrug transport system fused ATPase/permease subunit
MPKEDRKMKDQDTKLMKRLLSYAKPYTAWFVLVFALMLGATFADLLRPVILGDAIDLFMESYKTPLVKIEHTGMKDAQIEDTISFGEDFFRYMKKNEQVQTVYQIVQFENQYYWIENMVTEDAITLHEVAPEIFATKVKVLGQELIVQGNENQYTGTRLTGEELKILRSLDFKLLIGKALLFLVVLLCGFLFTYLQIILLQYIGQKIILAIRLEIYEKVLSLPFRFFNHNPIGKLVTRVTNDTETLNEMYTSVLVNLLKQVLFVIGVLIMMLRIHAKTTLWILLLIPIVVVITIIFRHYSRKAYRQVRNKLTEMNTFLSEHISGMRVIQLFAREKTKVEEMDKINQDLYKAGILEMSAFMLFRPAIFLLSYIAIGLVLVFGGSSVLAGTLSIGALIMLISYTKDFFSPIEELAENFNVLQSALASAEKIFTILDEENEMQNGNIQVPEHFLGEIEFKNVWFAYEKEDWILKNVSFKISKGQSVAFVGATGAGKSSILSLICRYYDCQKGEILIDGMNIQQYDIYGLRKQIGQVLQDVFMFTGDIKTNIGLGQSQVTLDQIKEAAQIVNAHTFIDKFDKGYDQEVLERGSTLSTGQRQLISFARAVVFKPKIFILDEATANIDTETEGLIQDALGQMMKGRTTLMVAHRLSTIQNADNIIVLHKGVIREMGTHQELLKNEGIYYGLYQLALKNQVMA